MLNSMVHMLELNKPCFTLNSSLFCGTIHI